MVRAKFTVTSHQRYSAAAGAGGVTIRMAPVYDSTIEEDRRFNTATPSGELTMFVNNPKAVEELEIGRAFYLDFTPA